MKCPHVNRQKLFACGSLAVAIVGVLVEGAAAQYAPDPPAPEARAAQPGDPPARPPRADRDRRDEPPVAVTGTLRDFNLGPRGEAEGMILAGDGNRTVQVNFPPPLATTVTQGLKAGDAVNATAVPRLSMPDHPVYDLVSMKVGDKEINVPRPEDAKEAKVDGTVKRLNFGRDGRTNGAVLESGEFVRIGSAAADQIKLAVGQKLTVEGMQLPTPTGTTTTINARKVNDVDARPEPPRDGPKPQRGPDGRGRPGPERPDGGPDDAPRPQTPPPP